MLRPYQLLKREHLEAVGFPVVVDHVRRPDGQELSLRRVIFPDSAYVVPLTEDGQMILVRQWRQSIERFTLEIVAGGVDEGETPAEAAHRELAEEAGYTAAVLEELAVLQLPGAVVGRQYFYLARDCRPIAGDWRALHAAEPTEPLLMPAEQAFSFAGREIDGQESTMALLLAERVLREVG